MMGRHSVSLGFVGILTLAAWMGFYWVVPDHPLSAKETTVVAMVVAVPVFVLRWAFGKRQQERIPEKSP